MDNTPIQLVEMSLPNGMATSARACEECTACCEIVAVEELGKPHYAKCEHCAVGCSIYEKRPASCKYFACLWKSIASPASKTIPLVEGAHRPDKIGAMFGFEIEQGVKIVDIFEVRRLNSKDAKKSIQIAEGIRKKMRADIIRYTPYGTRLAVHHAINPKYGIVQAPINRVIEINRGAYKLHIAGVTMPPNLKFAGEPTRG